MTDRPQSLNCPACGESLEMGFVGHTAYLTWSRKPGGWAAYFGKLFSGTRMINWFFAVKGFRCPECELYVVLPKRKRSQ